METTNIFKFNFRNSKREVTILEKTSYSFKLQVDNITKKGKECISYINYTIDAGMTITEPDGSPYSKDPKYLLPPIDSRTSYDEEILNDKHTFNFVKLLLALNTEDKPYFHFASFLYTFIGEVTDLRKIRKTVYLFEVFSKDHTDEIKALELIYNIPNISIFNGLVNINLLKNKFTKLSLDQLINKDIKNLNVNLSNFLKFANELPNRYKGNLSIEKDFKKSAYRNISKSFNKLNNYYKSENQRPNLKIYDRLVENRLKDDFNGFRLYYSFIIDYINNCYKTNTVVDSQESAKETLYEYMRNKQDLTFIKESKIMKQVFERYNNFSPIYKELINKQEISIFNDLFNVNNRNIKRQIMNRSYPWLINTHHDFRELLYGVIIEKYTQGYKDLLWRSLENDIRDLLGEMYLKLNRKIYLSVNIFKNNKYNEYLKRINDTGNTRNNSDCSKLINEFKEMIKTDYKEYLDLTTYGDEKFRIINGMLTYTGREEDIKQMAEYLTTGDIKSLKEMVLVRLFNQIFSGIDRDEYGYYDNNEILVTLHLTNILFPDLLNWKLISDSYKTIKKEYLPIGNNKLTIVGSHKMSSYVERSEKDYKNFKAEIITEGSLTAISHLSKLYLGQDHIKSKSEKEIGKIIFEKLKNKFEQKTDFTILYPKNVSQLFIEGSNLNNCVYSYRDLIARGESIVLFMRDKNEPDKPLYTVELDIETGEVIQLSGLNDSVPPLAIIKKINSVIPVSLKLSKFEIEKLN